MSKWDVEDEHMKIPTSNRDEAVTDDYLQRLAHTERLLGDYVAAQAIEQCISFEQELSN